MDTLEGVIHDHRSIYDASLPIFQGWQPGVGEPASLAHAGGGPSPASPPPSQADQQPEKQPEKQPDQPQLVVDSCFVSHPGSLTCTSASVVHNPDSDTVVLSIRASVRKTEASASSNMLDLEELGWLALKNTAAQRAGAQRNLNPQSVASGEHDERHGTILRMLSTGTVTDAVKSTNGFGHVSYVVTLQDPQTRQKCKALFKPTLEGDGDGWHRVPIEAAAYHLNRLLGMDHVPPAAYRSSCDVDWQFFEEGGTFIYFCPSAKELKQVPMAEWGCRPELLLSDTRILDVLIQNSDRHAGHFLWADHWSKGSYKGGQVKEANWRGRKYPVLIDQAAGFRPDAFVCLDHNNAFLTGPTRTISAKTYMRLRFLDRSMASSALGDFITEEELSALLDRKDAILRYFDRLVEKKGYAKVVLEDSCDLPGR